MISSQHIEKTLAEKIFRSNLIEEKIGEMIENGTIMIDVDGQKVGQGM